MISVTIIVKDGEKHLQKTLGALKNFIEIVLIDTGSTDASLQIAEAFSNVRVFKKEFIGFGPTHNLAASLTTHDWILSIDADEVLSPALAQEILSLPLNPKQVYALPFENYFNGKQIRWCGWHPESHVRLYNKKKTRFSEDLIHEKILIDGLTTETLKHPVKHYSYDSLSDFLKKMERYSSLFAEQYRDRRRSSPLIAIYHGVGAFLKSYVLKRGFLGGYEGFVISIYNGHTAFYKYLKLYHTHVDRSSLSQNR